MSTPTRPAGRYGDDAASARRRRFLPVGVALAALGCAWVVWAGLGAADRDVRWNDVGYVIGDDQVRVTFDVVKAPGSTAVCEVEALSSGYGTVGLVRVEVPAAEARVVRRSVDVPTQERAVSGLVRTCRAG